MYKDVEYQSELFARLFLIQFESCMLSISNAILTDRCQTEGSQSESMKIVIRLMLQ